MTNSSPKTFEQIKTNEIATPREADLAFYAITRQLGHLALTHKKEPIICPSESFFAIGRVHVPVEGINLASRAKMKKINIPKLEITQVSDPCVLGAWAISMEAEPMEDGTPTVNNFVILEHPRITVERRVASKDNDSYYAGVVEMGVVYDLSEAQADMNRLNALKVALETTRFK